MPEPRLHAGPTKKLAGAEGFEPPSPVLETSSLTVELTPLHPKNARLLGFFMSRMLAATIAELGKLQARCGLLLVLRRAVIAPLTFEARERDDVSHNSLLESGNRVIGSLGNWVIW